MTFREVATLSVLFVNSETVGEARTAWPKLFAMVEKGALQISKKICRSLYFIISIYQCVKYERDSQ